MSKIINAHKGQKKKVNETHKQTEGVAKPEDKQAKASLRIWLSGCEI